MTSDDGMDDYATGSSDLPIGRDRTILHLQRRIKLLEAMLMTCHGIIREQPANCSSRGALQEIEKEISRDHFTSRNFPETS